MKSRLIVLLDNIRSHHNVGSVFRSADAFAVEEIILSGICPRPPHRDIEKTALGATQSVHWRSVDSALDILSELKTEGYRIIGIEQSQSSRVMPSISEIKEEAIVLILGNEVKGVSTALLSVCDEVWEIEQYGKKKSLNVSVCAGICMHWIRQGFRN